MSMKIRLEQGWYGAIVVGVLLCSYVSFYVFSSLCKNIFVEKSFDVISDFTALCIGLLCVYIVIFFIKSPLQVIKYNPKKDILMIPYSSLYGEKWNGKDSLGRLLLSPILLVRRRIKAKDIQYILVFHYQNVEKILQEIAGDKKAIDRIHTYLGIFARPNSSTNTSDSMVALGLGGGVGNGNLVTGAASGVMGAVATDVILKDAIKNDYNFVVRTVNEIFIINIGYGRRRSDVEPFLSFLKTKNLKIIQD